MLPSAIQQDRFCAPFESMVMAVVVGRFRGRVSMLAEFPAEQADRELERLGVERVLVEVVGERLEVLVHRRAEFRAVRFEDLRQRRLDAGAFDMVNLQPSRCAVGHGGDLILSAR